MPFFLLFLMFVKLVLLITFFWCIFSQLFQRIRNQREIFLLTGTWVDKRSVEGIRLKDSKADRVGSWVDGELVGHDLCIRLFAQQRL